MKTTTPQNAIEAIRCMVGGCFIPRPVNDPWDMAGDRHKKHRKAVMSALLGRPAKSTEYGVNAIQFALAELLRCSTRELSDQIRAIRLEMERGEG